MFFDLEDILKKSKHSHLLGEQSKKTEKKTSVDGLSTNSGWLEFLNQSLSNSQKVEFDMFASEPFNCETLNLALKKIINELSIKMGTSTHDLISPILTMLNQNRVKSKNVKNIIQFFIELSDGHLIECDNCHTDVVESLPYCLNCGTEL